MKRRVDEELLNKIQGPDPKICRWTRLTMNQESLAECIFPHKWFNPFPKFQFFGASGHGGGVYSGGKYRDPGGQFPGLP